MKKICAGGIFAACLLVVTGIDARADLKLTQWARYRDIGTAQLQEGKNYRILVDGPVYDASQASLADLRLVQDGQFETPYEIVTARAKNEVKSLTPAILERSSAADGANYFIFDLGPQVRPHNKITLEIPGRNFGKKVMIEGSDDRAAWTVLARDAYIYDFSFGGDTTPRAGEVKWNRSISSKYMVDFSYNTSSRDTAISYQENSFRYVKLTLFNSKDEEQLNIAAAPVISHYTVPAEEYVYPAAVRENMIDTRAKTTEAVLDFGLKNLPVSRLKIECDGYNYYRTVTVEGSNDGKDWSALGSGEIFDYNVESFKDARKIISFSEGRCRYIKLTIINQDNIPINVISAAGYGMKRYAVFPYRKKGSLRLYYGNDRAAAPVYDYARFVGRADVLTLPVAELSGQGINALYAPEKIKRPWTEEHPYVLWAAVLGIVVIMLFLVASMIKKVK